jgi:hypothetical protein
VIVTHDDVIILRDSGFALLIAFRGSAVWDQWRRPGGDPIGHPERDGRRNRPHHQRPHRHCDWKLRLGEPDSTEPLSNPAARTTASSIA